ncbi:MAG TPA: hypothetical protein VGI10_01195 [Polyangiaceae bacterium]|jgi:hypothetical protein
MRVWILALIAVPAACSSSGGTTTGSAAGATGSSAGAAGAGSGGTSAGAAGTAGVAGASAGAAGRAGSGGAGNGGLSGAGGCGPCPGTACSVNAIMLQVTAPGGSGGSSGVIGSLSAQSSGVTMNCTRSGCGFVCTSQGTLADGSYSISLSAPGYQSKTVQIAVTNPTNCGCCGCCPFSTNQPVSLVPDGSTITGCCSDLVTDPSNCGSCGKACAAEAWCASGTCTPIFAPCVTSSSGYTSCTDYCQKQGKTCAAACGPSGTESIEWWGQGSVNCGDNIDSSNGTCDQSLAGLTGVRCCCAG